MAARHTVAGNHAEAADAIDRALAAAPSGSAAWLLPIEPLLTSRRTRRLGPHARQLRNRAVTQSPITMPSSSLSSVSSGVLLWILCLGGSGFRTLQLSADRTSPPLADSRWHLTWPHACGHFREERDANIHSSLSRFTIRHAVRAAILTLLFCTPALSQTLPPPVYAADLAGPRFGVTFLAPGVVEKLAARDIQRELEHLAVRLAVREAVLRQGRRRDDGHRMGRAARADSTRALRSRA